MQLKGITFRRMVIMYSTWWIIWIIAQTYVLTDLGLPFTLALTDSSINNLLLALAGIIIFNTLRFYQPARDQMFYLRIWAVLLAVISTMLFNRGMQMAYEDNAGYLLFLDKGSSLRYCYNQLMIALITLMNGMWFYFKSYQENDARKIQAETLAKEAELTSLRQQLQPHFLFNSLNSISALAGSRPEEARKMIQQLSEFLRGTMKKDEQQLVPLKDELQHLDLYLQIEKVRFGHRLNTEITCSDDTLRQLIPTLLLQPVVENAIKFGLYDTTGDICISIVPALEDNDLVITVQNPFDPETAVNKGTGFGLSSVQRRLYLLFARKDLLQTRAEGNVFTTTLRIPQKT